MARDLNEAWGWIERLIARVSRLESGSMLEKVSITAGRMRFIGGVLRLDSNALLELVGKANITGTLEGVGTILWRGSMKILGLGTLDVDGPATFKATLDVTADTRLRGPTSIEDTLDVTAETRLRGDTTLEKNLSVRTGGKITVEGSSPVTIGVTSDGRPGVEMSGGRLSSAEDRVALTKGTATLGVADTFAAMAFGANAMLVRENGTTFVGAIHLPDLPTISGVSANVTVDPDTGELGVI
jgi:hypothetical protein